MPTLSAGALVRVRHSKRKGRSRYPRPMFYMEMDDDIDVWRLLHDERDIAAQMHQPDEP